MNLTSITLAILAGGVFVVGGIIGYFIRVLLFLGKKGSMELTIKSKMVEADSAASKIVTEAERKATSLLEESKRQINEKESQLAKVEARLLQKDETLDKRQTDIDKEV